LTSSASGDEPHWITGFCDRSASFSIIVSQRKSSGKWEIRPTFEILIAQEHKAILDRIHAFFGVGKVMINGKNAVFRVQVLSELVNVIIPHFTAFPLLTTKVITFTVWAQAVALFNAGAHKTEEGFMQIVSIYAAIGRGVSKTVAVHFPNLQPVSLPKYELTTPGRKTCRC
jgi:hypothetical protein